MRFLLKKDGSDKNELALNELIKLLNISGLEKKIQSLEKRVIELEKVPIADKENILELIKSEFLRAGEVINISSAPSIEKDSKLKIGSMYYAPSKGLRLKTKEGWTTVKLD